MNAVLSRATELFNSILPLRVKFLQFYTLRSHLDSALQFL